MIIQRFGGALNLNVHVHALVLNGVCAVEGSGAAFHPMRRLTREDAADVVARIARRVERRIERRGLAGGAENQRGARPLVGASADPRRGGGPRPPVRAFSAHRLTAVLAHV